MYSRNNRRPGQIRHGAKRHLWRSLGAIDAREGECHVLRVPRPPWAHGELHSSCEIAPPISMSEKILGGKRFLHPCCMEPRGQTCRTRTRDGRCTREM